MKVTTGQQLSFSAEGKWNVDYRNFSYVGPEGYPLEEDNRIYQGCKLDPTLPYGKLLVRIGNDPSFRVIGSDGFFTANRDGYLAFRIHDGDACLGDNAGSVRVTITAANFSAVPQLPFFYCITGPGGGCQDVYTNPVPNSNLSPPPQWLTSPLAAKCLIPFTTQVLDKLMPGLGNLSKILDIAKFYETFYSLAQQRRIPLTDAQSNPLYWRTLVDALVQQQVVDKVTLKSCLDWAALLR